MVFIAFKDLALSYLKHITSHYITKRHSTRSRVLMILYNLGFVPGGRAAEVGLIWWRYLHGRSKPLERNGPALRVTQ